MSIICPILFVGGAAAPTADDQYIIDYITARGYPVVYVEDGAAVTADADNKSAVFISETVFSTLATDKFKDVPIGILTNEHFGYDTLYMATANGGSLGGQTNVNIVATHPLTAGQPLGNSTIFSAPSTIRYGFGLGPGAVVLAQNTTNATQFPYFSYETGSAMLGGVSAPGRRVAFPSATTHFDNLNANGEDLLNASLAWVTQPYLYEDCAGECGGESIPDCAGVCYIPPDQPPNCAGCDGVCRTCCDGSSYYDCSNTCNVCLQEPP